MNLSFKNKSVIIIKENHNNLDDIKSKILNSSISNRYKKDKIIISMKYKNEHSINLFGKAFLKNNNKKCRIVYEGKKKELSTKINPDKKIKDFIKVKLILYDNLVSIEEFREFTNKKNKKFFLFIYQL